MLAQVPVQDDDISSIMMRGATDLRNAKYEIEELVRVLTRIHRKCTCDEREIAAKRNGVASVTSGDDEIGEERAHATSAFGERRC